MICKPSKSLADNLMKKIFGSLIPGVPVLLDGYQSDNIHSHSRQFGLVAKQSGEYQEGIKL